MQNAIFKDLPTSDEFMTWSWGQIEALYRELAAQSLSAENIAAWLAGWSEVMTRVDERDERLYLATSQDTTDRSAKESYTAFLDDIEPHTKAWDQHLKRQLLDSGLEPEGFEIPLRNMRAEAEIYREANLPLLVEEKKLYTRYDEITGAQTVTWEGGEITLQQLRPAYQDGDRRVRERAWRLAARRWLDDREDLNALWVESLKVRRQIARNAGYRNYRAYRWQELLRFDYTPEDCVRFHRAIEEAVLPAAARVYERRRRRLQVETLRPWDLEVDPGGRPPLRPFKDVAELTAKTGRIFNQTDPQLGRYFETMYREGLLDLDNRKGKAAGGYCTEFATEKRPFIFMNAVGLHDDVQTLLHEAGHAFHVFERAHLPYFPQTRVTMEIAEVASMAMELLAAPYLAETRGGFYSEADAARARVEHLEGSLLFWPYMAVVDAFQHWVYENPQAASAPDHCDEAWAQLWDRFMGGVDWSGLEQEKVTGWQRKGHIFQDPFYYVDYGLAQLGAVQVWRRAREDPRRALADYRKALALGGTAPLAELFAAAGARLSFDANTLGEAVALMEATLAELDGV